MMTSIDAGTPPFRWQSLNTSIDVATTPFLTIKGTHMSIRSQSFNTHNVLVFNIPWSIYTHYDSVKGLNIAQCFTNPVHKLPL